MWRPEIEKLKVTLTATQSKSHDDLSLSFIEEVKLINGALGIDRSQPMEVAWK